MQESIRSKGSGNYPRLAEHQQLLHDSLTSGHQHSSAPNRGFPSTGPLVAVARRPLAAILDGCILGPELGQTYVDVCRGSEMLRRCLERCMGLGLGIHCLHATPRVGASPQEDHALCSVQTGQGCTTSVCAGFRPSQRVLPAMFHQQSLQQLTWKSQTPHIMLRMQAACSPSCQHHPQRSGCGCGW